MNRLPGVFVLTLLLAANAFAATYYVDASAGDDGSQGTSETSPWNTIAKVNSMHFQPGDFVLFKRGETWNEKLVVPSSGTTGNYITFGAYGTGENPTINGNYERDYCIVVSEKEFIVIENIDLEKANLQNITLYKSDYCIVRDLTTSYAKRDGLRICYGNATGNLIERVVSHHNGEPDKGGGLLLDTGATGNTVRHCTCYENAEDGTGIGGWPGNYGGINNVFEYNHCYNNHESGMDIKNGPQIVRYNTLNGNMGTYDNEGEGIALTYDSTGVEIYGNEIYDNTWNGIRISSSNNGGSHTIQGNKIYDNGKRGIYGEGAQSESNKIYSNLIYGNGDMGVFLGGTPETEVYNNVIWGNAGYQLRVASANNQLKNNILGGGGYAIAVADGGDAGLASNYNLITGTGDFCLLNWKKYTFAEWQSFSGQDSESISQDPLFVSSSDFRLQPESPAIDAGTDTGISSDFEGNAVPQGLGYDIGAYEFQGAADSCQGSDSSCGSYPDCQNCNLNDGCSGDSYRDYYCSGESCLFAEDNCSDCSCGCGGFGTTESPANNNCSDGKDNDCDGTADSGDTGCQAPDLCGNSAVDEGENCANCPEDAGCSQGQICCSETCQTTACSADSDCNDADQCTTDSCQNPGTCSAACSNTEIPGCGTENGATYYVDKDSRGGACDDSNPGTQTQPWCTIGKANSTLQPGDTVYLREATYSETISPNSSGASETSRITYANHANENVTITDVHYGLRLEDKSYVTITGLNFDNIDYGLHIARGSHNHVEYCTFNKMRTYVWYGSYIRDDSQYNWVHHCSFSRWGQVADRGGGVLDDWSTVLDIGSETGEDDQTHYNLIEDNNFFYGGHHVLRVHTEYNIIRNNYFHNENWMPFGENLYGNRNMVLYGEHGNRNLVEGNRIAFSGLPPDDLGSSGLKICSQRNIVRFNEIFHNNATGVHLAPIFANEPSYNYIYHNTIYHNGYNPQYYHGGLDFCEAPATGNAIKNNLFHDNIKGRGIVFEGTARREDQIIESNWDEEGDPLFVDGTVLGPFDLSLPDLRLQESSPCIDAGAFLTKTASSSANGTTIEVEDAGYFMDGWGVIEADEIQLEGQTQTAQVTAVDYENNTIAVDRPLSWATGQGVSLVFSGSAPDIGAFEFQAAPICQTVACYTDSDCDDADQCTSDSCQNPGTCSATCSNTVISGCQNLPPEDDTVPPGNGVAPPEDGTVPPGNGAAPPEDGTVPPGDGSEPPQTTPEAPEGTQPAQAPGPETIRKPDYLVSWALAIAAIGGLIALSSLWFKRKN